MDETLKWIRLYLATASQGALSKEGQQDLARQFDALDVHLFNGGTLPTDGQANR